MYSDKVEPTYETDAAKVPDAVKFAFHHALMQLKFSAKTAENYAASYTVKVNSITIDGLYGTGTLDCTASPVAWTTSGTTTSYTQAVGTSVGALSMSSQDLVDDNGYVLMLIPQSLEGKTVTFTLDIQSVGDSPAVTDTTVTLDIPALADGWKSGTIYKYTATLNLNANFGWDATGFGEPDVDTWGTKELPLN